MFQSLRKHFFTGLFITAPAAITLYVIIALVTWLDNLLVPLIPAAYRPEALLGFNIAGTGVVAGFFLMVAVGVMVRFYFGRKLVSIGEWFVAKVPVVNWLYGTIKQVMDTLGKGQKDAFHEVVLMEWPRKNVWSIAFVTSVAKAEPQYRLKDDSLVTVFMPTTPNPTNGFQMYVPRKELVTMDMTVDEAMKTILAMGIIAPSFDPNNPKRAAIKKVTEKPKALKKKTAPKRKTKAGSV